MNSIKSSTHLSTNRKMRYIYIRFNKNGGCHGYLCNTFNGFLLPLSERPKKLNDIQNQLHFSVTSFHCEQTIICIKLSNCFDIRIELNQIKKNILKFIMFIV